jgi:hypothetical protein
MKTDREMTVRADLVQLRNELLFGITAVIGLGLAGLWLMRRLHHFMDHCRLQAFRESSRESARRWGATMPIE